MKKILGTTEVSPNSLGNKAFNLLKLERLKLTPNFLVISADLLNRYIKNNKIILPKSFLTTLYKNLDILQIDHYIVRSSFTLEDGEEHTYAGIFESYITNKKEEIPKYIDKIYQSLFSQRFISYSKYLNLKNEPQLSIIIQQFIQPDIAGVILGKFDRKGGFQCVIEFAKNSYNRVTSGRGSDNTILIHKTSEEMAIATTEIVSGITENCLYKFVDIIEIFRKDFYKFDIEFVIKDQKIYIVQIRNLPKFSMPNCKIRIDTHPVDETFSDKIKKLNKLMYNFSKKFKIPFNLTFYFNKKGVYCYSKEYLKFQLFLFKKLPNKIFLDEIYFYLHLVLLKILYFFSNNMKKNRISHIALNYFWAVKVLIMVVFMVLFIILKYYFMKRFPKIELLDTILLTNPKSLKLEGNQKRFKRILKNYPKDLDYLKSVGKFLSIKNETLRHRYIIYDMINRTKTLGLSVSENFPFNSHPERLNRSKFIPAKILLKGETIIKGNVDGIAKIVLYDRIPEFIESSNILILEFIGKDILSLIMKAKAIIVEETNVLSHAAIICRELDKPLIRVDDILSYVKDGDRIKIRSNKITIFKNIN